MENPPISNGKEGKEKLKFKILMADDDSVITSGIKAILEDEGHLVETVEDGEDLIKRLIPNHGFDIVITDNTMLRMSGFEAIKIIRATDYLKNLPIIMLTTESEFLKSEVEPYNVVCLDKPISIDDLEYAIQKRMKSA